MTTLFDGKSRQTPGRYGLCLMTAAALLPGISGTAAVFDFDTATPTLGTYDALPFSQTKGGLTATFSVPLGTSDSDSFSISDFNVTSIPYTLLTGQYLVSNGQFSSRLDIGFSKPLSSLTFDFSIYNPQAENSTIYAAAYVGTTASTAVKTTSFSTGADGYPEGTLTLSSDTPFNLVEIYRIPQGNATLVFSVDNINATTAVPEPRGFVLLAGLGLAAFAGWRKVHKA